MPRYARPFRSSRGQQDAELFDPSPYAPDGLHFTVEWKPFGAPTACWERIEHSWEVPAPLSTFQQARNVARILALRFDGSRAYRVIDPAGTAIRAFVVHKHLLEEEPGFPKRTRRLAPGCAAPLISNVLKVPHS